jgi:hypothetical protein
MALKTISRNIETKSFHALDKDKVQGHFALSTTKQAD